MDKFFEGIIGSYRINCYQNNDFIILDRNKPNENFRSYNSNTIRSSFADSTISTIIMIYSHSTGTEWLLHVELVCRNNCMIR